MYVTFQNTVSYVTISKLLAVSVIVRISLGKLGVQKLKISHAHLGDRVSAIHRSLQKNSSSKHPLLLKALGKVKIITKFSRKVHFSGNTPQLWAAMHRKNERQKVVLREKTAQGSCLPHKELG